MAAAAALFDGLSIPRASQSPKQGWLNGSILVGTAPWILIWGGSCVTGMMAIQFAKGCGLRVLAVANPQNASYLKSLGADEVIDRCQPEEAIALAKSFHISLAIDCVGQQTATFAAKSLEPKGKLVYLVKQPEQAAIDAGGIEVTDILIKKFHEDPSYGQSLVDYIAHGLFSRRVRPVRHEVIPGGWNGLKLGLEKLKSGTVSGRKLVIVLNS